MSARYSKYTVVRRTLLVAGISGLALLTPSNASAEAAAVSSNAAPAPPSSEVAPSVEPTRVDGGRVRLGIDFDCGVGADAASVGAMIGLKARLGWQFDHRAGFYLQGGMFNWQSSKKVSADGSFSSSGALVFQGTPLFALTPRDDLEFAAGPSLDYLLTTASEASAESGRSSRTTSNGTAVTYNDRYWGAHARVAFHSIPHPRIDTSRRAGVTFGGDLHTTFAEGGVVAFLTASVGGDWY
ncbi:hypothetical protein AKJ09_09361 [Labilithrix luteola]|uniref:Outer membrane protein beta-barrel domain-containing protein n=1 Tax=Labilithrix luteola TaxID=1391654 RepID=A0A0K1QAD5_9BACT|nr:hypothetical protein [Labilithrix luteola]AKV02698.1 hypothetical protein AKJ09_09361 [Labilithrix luteola]